MLIDTHCHIHDKAFDFDAAQTIKNAYSSGVEKIIVIGTSLEDNLIAKQYAAAHENVFWSYGYHPSEFAKNAPSPSIEHLQELADDKLVSIGEIGLDYHYEPFDRSRQIQLFELMLELAIKQNLPINFHVREAFEDFWPIVDNAKIQNAVLHSFSDSSENLQKGINRGYYIGVNGLATFAKLPLPPLEKMVLETDAPYLTPKPFRGKINEPGYVKNIAEWVATEFNVTLAEVSEVTTKNAETLFNL